MHAFEGIPPAALQRAPRIWINTEGGFGRRVIDPRWVTEFRIKSEEARERALRRAEAVAEARRCAAALAAVSKEERRRFNAEVRVISREAIAEAKRERWAAIAARWAEVGPLPSAKAILEAIADTHGFPVSDLVGTSRAAPVTTARQHAAYEIRRQRGLSHPVIGKLLNRDHTTILSAVAVWPKKAATLGIPCEPMSEAQK